VTDSLPGQQFYYRSPQAAHATDGNRGTKQFQLPLYAYCSDVTYVPDGDYILFKTGNLDFQRGNSFLRRNKSYALQVYNPQFMFVGTYPALAKFANQFINRLFYSHIYGLKRKIKTRLNKKPPL
jgi:hypothetical protein